jgi:hypothetical protein
VDVKEVREADMVEDKKEDMVEVEEDEILTFNFGDVFQVSIFLTKPCALYGYFYRTEHAIEYFHELLKKCEEKKAYYTWWI